MKRYFVRTEDKASKNREEYFVESGLLDFWSLAMKIIGIKNIPPAIIINDIETAYNVVHYFIAECGNTINVELPDGYNMNYLSGVEFDNETMRLIWYSVNKANQANIGETLNDTIVEMRKEIFGENLEQQYGFTLDRLLLTPSYILIYAKRREVPEEIDNNEELLKRQPHEYLTIYEHIWGEYKHEPILQYRTRYYCDEGLVAVLSPKACGDVFRPYDFYNGKG